MTSPVCLMSSKNSDAQLSKQLQQINSYKRPAPWQAPLPRSQSSGLNAFIPPQGKKSMAKKPKNLDNPIILWDNFNSNLEEENHIETLFSVYPEMDVISPVNSSMDPSVEGTWDNEVFDELSNDSNETNMPCVNPRDVEGLHSVGASYTVDAVVSATPAGDVVATIDVAIEENEVVIEVAEHNISDDTMNCSAQSAIAEMEIDDGNPCDYGSIPSDLEFDSDFNLLDLVTNDNVGINDLQFQTLIDGCDIYSSTVPLTINSSVVQIADNFVSREPNLPVIVEATEPIFEDDEKPVYEAVDVGEPIFVSVGERAKRGRGRPRVVRVLPVVADPPRRRGRPPSVALAANLPIPARSGSSEDQKYRRMRHLNNLASQRCRLNRKRKVETIFTQLEDEEAKNRDLTKRARDLQEKVFKLRKILEMNGWLK